MGPPAQSPAQMPMNAPPHHLQQNGPSHMGLAPNHMHQPMGPHGKQISMKIIQNQCEHGHENDTKYTINGDMKFDRR